MKIVEKNTEPTYIIQLSASEIEDILVSTNRLEYSQWTKGYDNFISLLLGTRNPFEE